MASAFMVAGSMLVEALSAQMRLAGAADTGTSAGLFAVLSAFGLVVVVAAGFVITNSFQTMVAARSRELALLRAVGMRGRQTFASVLVEGLLVGIVGALVGVALGSVGALVAFAGMSLLAPIFVQAMAPLVPVGMTGRPAGRLAVGNLARGRRRTSITAMAVVLGVTLFTGVNVVLNSAIETARAAGYAHDDTGAVLSLPIVPFVSWCLVAAICGGLVAIAAIAPARTASGSPPRWPPLRQRPEGSRALLNGPCCSVPGR